MDVYNELGHGFLEVVYKDALEIIFKEHNIFFEWEKGYDVKFHGIILSHKFYADFVVFNKIILVVRCVKELTDDDVSKAINYLKVSGNKLALLVILAE